MYSETNYIVNLHKNLILQIDSYTTVENDEKGNKFVMIKNKKYYIPNPPNTGHLD